MIRLKHIMTMAMVMTFFINPVLACCHDDMALMSASGTIPSENQMTAHSDCHETGMEAGTMDTASMDNEQGQDAPCHEDQCSGCLDCDLAYQVAADHAIKADISSVSKVEKAVSVQFSYRVDMGQWQMAHWRPPSSAPPPALLPIQLNNILIL
ncbi:MAG: hypothetical protein ACWA5L_07785 [bacterium]